MRWWEFALFGAGGGAFFEAMSIFKYLLLWQSARRTRSGRVRSNPPPLHAYFDVPAHAWMAVIRMALGAGVAALFGGSGQLVGPYAAVALGFAAPAVLARTGSIPQVASAVAGSSGAGGEGGAPTS